MFSPEERACLRSSLLELAHNDQRITGAAITGSGAASREDRWSDVDLAFGVNTTANLPRVLSDWTAHMYDQHRALHHLDVMSGAWTYRVFLLPSTLQVDLAFVVDAEFRALAPTLSSVHGRGIDMLPSEITAQFQDSLVRQLDINELSRAFRVVIQGLIHEIPNVDKELAERLQEVLRALSQCPL